MMIDDSFFFLDGKRKLTKISNILFFGGEAAVDSIRVCGC